jgi:hypothetical protein
MPIRTIFAALVFLFCCIAVFGQMPKDSAKVYLLGGPNTPHRIFITNQATTFCKQWLFDFSFGKFDWQNYKDEYANIKKKDPKLFKYRKRTKIAPNWLPLHHYKGEFYTYCPCEGGYNNRIIINDSSFVLQDMDGPYPQALLSIVQKSKKTFELQTSRGEISENVKIHLLDPKTNMAIFEFSGADPGRRYAMYVPRENVHYFKVIVNECIEEKEEEFEFDKFDFEALLKKK